MRVAIVSESFLPSINGVANSARHVAARLRATGHQSLIVAPGPGPTRYEGIPVVRARSVPLPGYETFPVGIPGRIAEQAIVDFRPDVVHLASPLTLGITGLRAAERLGVPAIAIFQTDIVGFARNYGFKSVDRILWRWLRRIHMRADRTLAPSTATARQLAEAGIPRVYRWGRGVDLDLFSPDRRDDGLRRELAPSGEKLIGYVGRLAPEKRVHLLSHLRGIPNSRLVVVGDGPDMDDLRRELPDASFLGFLEGEDLARAYASFDVFVHTGAHETFCQTIQEAQASGLPVVAPAAGGPLDLVRPGRTGFLYAPEDTEALRYGVAALTGNDPMRAAMSRAAIAAVADRGWDRIVDEVVDHYWAALDERSEVLAA